MHIDRNVFAELQESAGAEFVTELVDTFLEDAPALLDELRSARAAADADRRAGLGRRDRRRGRRASRRALIIASRNPSRQTPTSTSSGWSPPSAPSRPLAARTSRSGSASGVIGCFPITVARIPAHKNKLGKSYTRGAYE